MPIELWLLYALLGFLALTAVVLVTLRDLFAIVMLFSIYSLLSAGVFLMMQAADVAFTEAAVGAGVATVLMLSTLALTGGRERGREPPQPWGLMLVLVTGAALVWGTMDLPRFGDAGAPAHQGAAAHYLEQTQAQIGIDNVVTAVLASYRGFDTLGEVVVVFTAGLGVLLILGFDRRRRRDEER